MLAFAGSLPLTRRMSVLLGCERTDQSTPASRHDYTAFHSLPPRTREATACQRGAAAAGRGIVAETNL
jgi:hypothetical protein